MDRAGSKFSRAVALNFDERCDEAPSIAANERYFCADLVVALAERYGVPVVERPELARAVADLDDGEQIPRRVWRAVAELLAALQRDPLRG